MTNSPTSPAAPPPAHMARRRERLLPFLFIMAACLGVGALVVSRERTKAVAMIGREDAARTALEAVADAQRVLHGQSGAYGWLEDLEAADLLENYVLVDGESGRRQLATRGYRIDVLLPHVRMGPGLIGITLRGGEHEADDVLVTRHFAVVARPTDPGVTGTRIWYVDETGELFLNEGVVDDVGEAQNLLPTMLVTKNETLDTASLLLWQRASEIPPRHD